MKENRLEYAARLLRRVSDRELRDQGETIRGVIWTLERYIEDVIAKAIYGEDGEGDAAEDLTTTNRSETNNMEEFEDAMPEGYEEYKDEQVLDDTEEKVEIPDLK